MSDYITSPVPTALVAVGGNSQFARSMRAKLQWRDRFGRFIEMGRGIKFKFRRLDGSTVSANGTFVGVTDDANVGQVYIKGDPNGLKDGFYNIKSNNAQAILATLDPAVLKKQGIEIGKDASGNSVGDRLDEQIPNQADIPYSPAPTGWKVDATGRIWTSDDNEFSVRPLDYPTKKRTGKEFTLFRNGKSVGNFKGWVDTLEHVNKLDNEGPDVDPRQLRIQQQEKNADADKVRAEQQAALAPEAGDVKTRAKAAIAAFDTDNKIAALIDNNASSKDVLDALDNNSAWRTRHQNYTARQAVEFPTELDKTNWADTEKRLEVLQELDTPAPANTPDRATGHNLDLSVGDVAAEGYLVPNPGKMQVHDRADFDGDNATDLVANYVTANRDELASGGKRLSISIDTDNRKVSLDIVDQVADHNTAQQIASSRNESDIYDVKNSKVISTKAQRDPNATGIPGNTGVEDGNNADTDPNPVEPQGDDSGAGEVVGGPPREGGAQQDSGESNTPAPADSTPDTGAGDPNPSSDSNEPAGDSGNQAAPADAPEAREPEVAPAPPIVNPADDLPDDIGKLKRLGVRLEARAIDGQDGPAVDALNEQLRRVYEKIDRLGAKSATPDEVSSPDPVPDEAPKPETPVARLPESAPAPTTTGVSPEPSANSEEIKDLTDAVKAVDTKITAVSDDLRKLYTRTDGSVNSDEDILRLENQRQEAISRVSRDAQPPAKTPTPAEPAPKEQAPEVSQAPERVSEPSPAPQINSEDQEILNAQRDVAVAQRRLDAAQAKLDAGEAVNIGRFREDLEYAQEDLQALERIRARRAARRAPEPTPAPEAPRDEAPEAVDAPVAPENVPDAPEPVDVLDRPAEDAVDIEQVLENNPLFDPAKGPEQLDDLPEESIQDTPAPPQLEVSSNADGSNSRYRLDTGQVAGDISLGDGTYEADYFPGSRKGARTKFPSKEAAEQWLGDRLAEETGSDVNPITGDPVGRGNALAPVYEGLSLRPTHYSSREAGLNYHQSKDLSPEQRERVRQQLTRPGAIQGEVDDIIRELQDSPNQANTGTHEREDAPELPAALPQLVDVDPGQIADPNLIIQDVKRNHPDFRTLPNGDVVVESRNSGNKTYDLAVRRTRNERFFAYIRETDNDTGVVRAYRLGNESHSYKALRTKLSRGKRIMNDPNLSDRFGRLRNIETLPEDANGDISKVPDRIKDLADGLDLPFGEDESKNKIIGMIAEMAGRGANPLLIDALAKINNIPQSVANDVIDIVARQQIKDAQIKIDGGDGTKKPSHIPFGGGSSLKIGDWVDWTDTRQTVNGLSNPNYGRVYRGQVKQLRYKTNDGQYVYSDSTYVTFPEMNREAGRKPSLQRARISSTLKKVDGPDAAPSQPFYPKDLEARDQERVAPKAADFGVPATGTKTVARPRSARRDEPVEPKVDINGAEYIGNDNAPVPLAQSEAELVQEVEALDSVAVPASDIRVGDAIMRSIDGEFHWGRVSAVVHGVDGRIGISSTHFDSNGVRVAVFREVPQGLRILVRRQPDPASVEQAEREAEERTQHPIIHAPVRKAGDTVFVSDIPGLRGEVVEVGEPNQIGERTYVIRAEGNGLEYARQERYIEDDPIGPLAMRAASIQPPEAQADAGWKNDPATDRQRRFMSALLNKKKLSKASEKTVKDAIKNPNLTKGEASRLLEELINHRDNTPPDAKISDEIDKAAEVVREAANGLAPESSGGLSPRNIQHALANAERARSNAAAKHDDDMYGGYSVRRVAFDELGLGIHPDDRKVRPIGYVPASELRVGDLIIRDNMFGSGRTFHQILGFEGNNQIKYRVVAPADNTRANETDGYVGIGSIGDRGVPVKIWRPSDNDKTYFRPLEFDKDSSSLPKGLSIEDSYEDRARDMLNEFNKGWKQKGPKIYAGAINLGAEYIEINNGKSLFKKIVANKREFDNEILASKMLNAMGVKDIVVVGLPDGQTLIQDKVEGNMAADDPKNFDLIRKNPEKYPNARIIGLLDYLTVNTDRHAQNWFIDKNNQPVPIDHGYTWFTDRHTPHPAFAGPALGRLMGLRFGPNNDPMFTEAELIQLRAQLYTLKGDFLDMGREDWYNFVIMRINTLIANYRK